MDPIEKAIRGALEKGNTEDPAFRRRIYASAEQAFLRSLQAKPGIVAAERDMRVAHLRSIAAQIETEFTPASAPNVAPQVRNAAQPGPFRSASPAARIEPHVSDSQARRPADPSPQIRAVPGAAAGRAAASKVTPQEVDNRNERKRKNRLFNRLAGLFVLVTLLAMAIMLGWAIWTSDLLNTQERAAQKEASSGANAQDDDAANWITVFQPADISTVALSDGVTAELQGAGKDAYLRLQAQAGEKNGQATFEFGRGILESLQGKKIVIDINASTKDGSLAEIAAGCDLAGLGQCQRTRFHLDGQINDNLMVIQLADQGPEASGVLTISPDLAGTGAPVNIHSIRVRIEP